MQSKLQRILNSSAELLKFSIGAARQQSEASVLSTSPGIRGPDRGSVWLRLAPTALQSVPYWPNSCTGLRHGPLPPPCHTQQPLSQAQKSPWQRGSRQPPALFFHRVLSISSQKTPLLQASHAKCPPPSESFTIALRGKEEARH